MNARKVPQLFVNTGASRWNDPTQFPWTMGFYPEYQKEARVFAEDLLKNHPQGKIGILYQNDDFGKDYVKGLKDRLHSKLPRSLQNFLMKSATRHETTIAYCSLTANPILLRPRCRA